MPASRSPKSEPYGSRVLVPRISCRTTGSHSHGLSRTAYRLSGPIWAWLSSVNACSNERSRCYRRAGHEVCDLSEDLRREPLSPLALANEGAALRAYRCESYEVENVADILVGGPSRDLTALSTRVVGNERSCRSGNPVPGCQEGRGVGCCAGGAEMRHGGAVVGDAPPSGAGAHGQDDAVTPSPWG